MFLLFVLGVSFDELRMKPLLKWQFAGKLHNLKKLQTVKVGYYI